MTVIIEGEIMEKNEKLLPLKSDIVFKAIFGNPKNRDSLAAFLNDVLGLDIMDPEDIEYLNTEISPDYDGDKLSRLDLRILVDKIYHIEVEIQIQDRFDMVERSLYYLSKLFAAQMKQGMKYNQLCRTISLIILDYNLLNEPGFYNTYRFKNIVSNTELSKIMEVNYLELKKVPKESTITKELWAMAFATESEEVLAMLSDRNDDINKVVEKLKYVSADDEIRFKYEQREKARLDYFSDMSYSKEEGREEGARSKALAIATSLLDILDVETIAEKTQLSIETVKELKRQVSEPANE